MVNRLRFPGRLPIPGPGILTLQNLTLSGLSYNESDPAGTVIGAIQNTTATSVLALTSPDSRIAISGTNLVVGANASIAGATITPSIRETLAAAGNSPKVSGPFQLVVNPATPTVAGYGNDGTNTVPGGAVSIANRAALYAALPSATPGTVFILAAGDYAELDFNAAYQYAAPGIVIQGGAGVHCRNIYISSSQGITVQYVDVTGVDDTGVYCTLINNSVRCTINHCTIDPANYLGVGGFVRDGSNNAYTHNLVQRVGDGLDAYTNVSFGNQNLVIEYNKVVQFATNAMLLIQVQHLRVRFNFIGASNTTNVSDHPDSIQLQTCDDVEVSYNNFDLTGFNPAIDHCGGIGFSEAVSNFHYHHNCNLGADDNGMSLGGGVEGCFFGIVEDNFSQGVTGHYSGRYIIRDSSHDVIFRRNQVSTTPAIVVYDGSGVTSNLTMGAGADVNVTIPLATSFADVTRRNAFLAANPLIALP